MDDTLPLPNDLAGCHQLIAEQAAKLKAQSAALQAVSSSLAAPSVEAAVAGSVQISSQAPNAPSGVAAPQAKPKLKISPLVLNLDELTSHLRDREARLEEQARAVVALQQDREQLQREVETLQLTLDKLLKQIYGRRSERFLEDPTQQKFDFGNDPQAEDTFRDAVEDAEKVIEEIAIRRQEKKPVPQRRSEAFPEHLARVIKTVEPTAAQLHCTLHGERQLLGYDEVQTLKFKRPELYVEVTRYPKYVCPSHSDCGVTQPPRPLGLVSGNRFDSSIAVEVIVQKYAYHLPYYRQQDWFSACGWCPARSTLQNIAFSAAAILTPVVEYWRQGLVRDTVLGCDETPVTLIVPKVLPDIDPLNPRSKRIHEVFRLATEKHEPTVKARMWAYRGIGVPLNVFDFTVSRHRDGPDEVLANYTGTLMGDCWSGFQKIDVRSDMRIARAACWAHARRKVFDGRSSDPLKASALLALIRQLYDIEDRGRPLSPGDRLALRQREAIPLLNRIRLLLDGVESLTVLPKSAFGEALGYLRNHWQALLLYTTNGLIPIDNNEVEQLMKQVATGRKNWMFIGSVEAGNHAATLLTLISSAVRHDLDVSAYLKDIFDQLLAGSTDYDSMRADIWKQSHPEHIRVYRQEERRDASDRRTQQRATRRIEQSPKKGATGKDAQK